MIKKIKLTGTSGNAETEVFEFEGANAIAVETGRRNISGEEELRLWNSGESSAIEKRRSFRDELDAKEAIIIDTSKMSIAEVEEKVMEIYKKL